MIVSFNINHSKFEKFTLYLIEKNKVRFIKNRAIRHTIQSHSIFIIIFKQLNDSIWLSK